MTLRTRLAVAFLTVAGGPVALAAGFVSRPVLAAMAGLAALLAGAAGWWLARSHRRRVAELARAADRVAGGDLGVRVAARPGDGTGQLAATFNRMTHRTQSYVRALTASRDQLRRQLAVLGDTLSSTHDLDRILHVILRTALVATGARSGAVLLLDQETATLVGQRTAEHPEWTAGSERTAGGAEAAGSVRTAGGAEAAGENGTVPFEVPVGAGLLGAVAATGEARLGTVATSGEPGPGRVAGGGLVLHESEPPCRTYVVVPISVPGGSMARAAPWPAPPAVRGVLALYDRLGGDEFDETDVVTLRTFAGQAAIAVDNVRTHEEAQRLSLTDPLTGLWNYRYLRESMRREVERASRFGHTLAVLALDLDHFKDVNDAYGHPAGDTVLVEFAHRLSRETREVDLAFRQGGEEFVVLLPETDARGAAVLAQRLGASVRDVPVAIAPTGTSPRPAIGITVSIGIAVYPDHALTPQGVLDAADGALYEAKQAGRDTHRVATVAPAPVAASELPVRAGARIPEDDLPHAGGPAPSQVSGPAPPRQNRSG